MREENLENSVSSPQGFKYKSGSISTLCGSKFMEPKKTEDRDLDSERAPYLGLGNAAHDFLY
jgi:hypothetical protein